MAEASVAARLENSGAWVGVVIQLKKKNPPRSSPASQEADDDLLPQADRGERGAGALQRPGECRLHQTGILMISLKASTALFLMVTTISVASDASVLAIM